MTTQPEMNVNSTAPVETVVTDGVIVPGRFNTIRNASRTGEQCGVCDRAFEDGEIVFRRHFRWCNGLVGMVGDYQLNGWSDAWAPICALCSEKIEVLRYQQIKAERAKVFCRRFGPRREFGEAVPCQGCGRPVRHRMDVSPIHRRVCSEACARLARNARARAARTRARGFISWCERCDEPFEPARADARHCSAACRQKAYRERVKANGTRGDTGDRRVAE